MTTTPIATTKNGTTPPTPRDERETTNGKPTSTLAEVPPDAPALPLDLKKQPDEVLALLEDEVPRERQRRQLEREAELFAEFKERARALGVPTMRLAAALGVKLAGSPARRPSLLRPVAAENGAASEEDGRRNVKPKYRNPKDQAQTWSGRGLTPQWVRDHQAAGGTMEQLAIPEGG